MISKLKVFLMLILTIGVISSAAKVSAQTVGEETIAISDSKLATIELPPGARRVKEQSVPQEFKTTMAKIIAACGDKIRQGETEVIIWEGDKTKNAQMTSSLEAKLKQAGWEYEVGEKNDQFTLFTLLRTEPQRRALVGFFVPSNDSFIFAITEMLPATAAQSGAAETKIKVGNMASTSAQNSWSKINSSSLSELIKREVNFQSADLL